MSEEMSKRKEKKSADAPGAEPVHVVRRGAIAASIWQRQSPSGFAYFDFTLSRSWKAQGTGKAGYSKSFFASNQEGLIAVISETAEWIAANSTEPSVDHAVPSTLAA